MKLTLYLDDESSDGKTLFINAKENEDLQIEINMDDVDPDYVIKAAKEIIRRVNKLNK